MTPQEAYQNLESWSRDLARLRAALGLLYWDIRTHMPPKATPYRSEVAAFLAQELHRRSTHPQIGEWIATALSGDFAQDLIRPESVNLHWWKRSYEYSQRIPEVWIRDHTRLVTEAEKVWEIARQENDFSRFAPYLDQLVKMAREQADYLSYEEDPYDALIDLYEPGMTTKKLQEIFAPLIRDLPTLIRDLPRPQPVLIGPYPKEKQEAFILEVFAHWGLGPEEARLDTTVHPFFTRITPGDLRITTRYSREDFRQAVLGGLHEAGHALYEKGLPSEHWGTPRGSAVSLGIHESQSRFWENFVGRSPSFWIFFYPIFQKYFPQHNAVPFEDFLRTINEMRPSLIRVEADEVTYNLHIFLRFELEHALIHGDITVQELPQAWNDRFYQLLGIRVPSDREGVLQDVHWSQGSFGYFPTYTLGNIYAAQIYEALRKDLDLETLFRQGEFIPIYEWLEERIYRWGKTFYPHELIRRVTGKDVSAQALLSYIREKISYIKTLQPS